MFTGISECTAAILKMSPAGVTIERPSFFTDLQVGSSIAISGCCLSIVELSEDAMRFDIVAETLRCTKLGKLAAGDRVNLERALKADGRFEGHIVQGHIDCVGSVQEKKKGNLTIAYPSQLQGLIVEKGSIAIDGVSLTVAACTDDTLSVALIPHTEKETTLGVLAKGDAVNLEVDILSKYASSLNRPLHAEKKT